MPKHPTDWHPSQRHRLTPESPLNKARRLRTERIARVIAEAQATPLGQVHPFPNAQPAPVLESPQIPGRDLRRLVELIGERGVLRQLNVHEKTLYRWLTGRVHIPGRQHLAIKALLGDLPGTDGKWTGWRFWEGQLVSPGGEAYHPGEVLAGSLRTQLIRTQGQEIERLRLRLAIAEEALERLSPAANDSQAVG